MPSTSLLDERMVAERLGISVKTLRRWRWAGRELGFVKIGACVRYEPGEVEAYIARQRQICPKPASA